MKKNILEGLLKRIRKKVGKEKEEEKGERKCTGDCTFPDCNEPLHGEVQKCPHLKNNGDGKCCTRPN
jgi:hypothetical protein